ncbi:outer membrane protein assembly factor BamB family protein [Bremerella alba]|uniref:Outer membrane protein assembly factor BamB n=1 Tax=Bremerella alba TaxID=980252 RepID=A0A7V8V5G9_9BACT|nr:PQQ-binding-like beta-propeller repeat protein [Bremerella alba]MBA2115121.1 Outer membrane protein assembly factor BamB [Bremerella alba]
MTILRIVTLLAVTGLLVSTASAENWPQFRGPNGDGITSAKDVPLNWGTDENVVWKTPIPGKGWSSPVLVGGKIWLTTAMEKLLSEEEKDERLKDAKPFQRNQSNLASTVELKAIEVDYQTGKRLRTVDLFHVDDPLTVHLTNTYASPTPVAEGKFVYCYFGTYGACCIDTETAQVVWRNNDNALEYNVGPGSSPVVVGDVVVLTCDGVDQQYITGVDKKTGKTIWKTERPPFRTDDGDRKKAYATPLVVEIEGQTQVVIPGAQWVCAYDAQTGEELWRADHGSGFSNVPAPVFENGTVYICSGFMRPQLVAIRADGEGDVTNSHIEWTFSRQVPTTPSPVVIDRRIYMVSDRGVATCVDAATGQEVWTSRMGGNYSASPTYADGRIYFCSESGMTTVIKPGDEYEVIAENDLGERIMANPIFLDGNVVIRTAENLVRIREAK